MVSVYETEGHSSNPVGRVVDDVLLPPLTLAEPEFLAGDHSTA
jgi:hypothetical protein